MPIFGHQRARASSRGRGRGIRWTIALIVAGIALFTYFSSTQINPITGESQRVGNLSPEDEVALGYNALPQLISQMGGEVPESDPAARLVRTMGERLVGSSRLADSPYRFRFTLLNDRQTVNAFALPGGPVFITRALLERLENEAQLAGVIGHEIGHVVHRHGAQRMAQGNLAQMLSVAVGIGASGEDHGRLATMAAAVAGQAIMMKYSRGDELESDDQGLTYMIDAGYDPSEMIQVMQILKSATREGSDQRPPDFLASHPHPDDRMAAIRKFVESRYPSGIPPSLTTGRPLPHAASPSFPLD